jgi:FkbM family methyltransferase
MNVEKMDQLNGGLRGFTHEKFRDYFRYFPMRRGKERLLQWLWKPLSFGCYRRITTLKDIPVEVECDLTQWIQRHLYFFGEYEPGEVAFWSRLSRKAAMIFDVGANVGIYSLSAAVNNQHAMIHAFEPTPEVFATLQANLRRNHCDGVTTHNMAVGKTTGAVFLHRCRGVDGANEGMNYVSDVRERDSDIEIRRVSLDDFCDQQGIQEIDLVKMDIEGNELQALQGAQNLLARKRINTLFLEINDWALARANSKPADVIELLDRADYQLFRFVNREIIRIDPRTEIPDTVIASRANLTDRC